MLKSFWGNQLDFWPKQINIRLILSCGRQYRPVSSGMAGRNYRISGIGGDMKEKTVVSSYPASVVIGNYRWHSGMNVVPETEWPKVHWPSIKRDLRLAVRESATSVQANAGQAARA